MVFISYYSMYMVEHIGVRKKKIRNPTKQKSCNFRQCHAIRNFVRILLIVSRGIDRSLIRIIISSFD